MLRLCLDLVAVAVVRVVTGTLRRLPLTWSQAVVAGFVQIVLAILPRHRRFALRNLELALPQLSEQERRRIMDSSFYAFARVLIDFARLRNLDERWASEHVSCPFFSEFLALKAANPGRGVLIATGHLGSFELLGHYCALRGSPLNFVVRNFQLPKLDAWWTAGREAYGNRIIPRKGAFQKVVRAIESGRDVALLIDQNVTRKHAVFVPWFGIPAATSKTLAIVALRTGAPIVVAAVHLNGLDTYEVLAEVCPYEDIAQDPSIDAATKVYRITERISKIYEGYIRRSPGEWFWMHRRWKTRPEGEPENLYARELERPVRS